MTDSMKKYLTAACAPKGSAVRGINDHLAASKAGWVKLWGYPQNSTTARYVITDAGRAALATA